MLRQAAKRVDMPTDVIEEVRAPRLHGNNVHQDQRGVFGTVQQMRKHFQKDEALRVKAGLLRQTLLRTAVSQQVEPVNPLRPDQRRKDPVPRAGRPRPAMREHQRQRLPRPACRHQPGG
jgi:hypothetical protein